MQIALAAPSDMRLCWRAKNQQFVSMLPVQIELCGLKAAAQPGNAEIRGHSLYDTVRCKPKLRKPWEDG